MGGMNLSAEYLPRCICGHLELDHFGDQITDHCEVCHDLNDEEHECFHDYEEAE